MGNVHSVSAERKLSSLGLLGAGLISLVLCAGAIAEAFRLNSLQDPNFWGNLSAGGWILENRAIPRTGIYSQMANAPWRDFHWGFDMAVAIFYRLLGVRVIPVVLMLLRLGLAFVTFFLAGRRKNVWGAAVCVLMVQYVLFRVGPGPELLSAVIWGVVLLLLQNALLLRDEKFLRVLPLIFICWANLDIGFVYGIALYALFLISELPKRFFASREDDLGLSSGAPLRFSTIALIGGASVVATLLNPYGYHVYTAFFQWEFSGINYELPGYTAMSFRQAPDYLLMLFGMTAFLFLGVRRSRDLFSLSVLSGAAALAFHAQREGWLLALASSAVIGWVVVRNEKQNLKVLGFESKLQPFVVGGVCAGVLAVLTFAVIPSKRETLLEIAGQKLPLRAANIIRQRQLPAPMFNSYAYGGFLTWYLPEYPVAMDARRGLFPEDEVLHYFQVMNAELPYQALPAMREARTFVLEKENVTGQALKGLPGFSLAYEDDHSLVLLHEGPKQ